MSPLVHVARALGWFVLAAIGASAANFLLQVGLVFVDVLTREDSSPFAIVALWLVTGVLSTVLTVRELAQPARVRCEATVVLVASAIGFAAALVQLAGDWPGRDPEEYAFVFESAWVTLAFFTGSGAMAGVLRHGSRPEPAGARTDAPSVRSPQR